MKKICSILLAMILLFSLPVCADIVTDGEAGYFQEEKIVYVEGNLKTGKISGDTVTLLLIKKGVNGEPNEDDIGYISQIPVKSDGSYCAKFRFAKDINQYNLQVKEGNNNVTSSVEIARVTEKSSFSVKYGATAKSVVQGIVNVKNKYSAGGEFSLVVGFYGENDNLIDLVVSNKSYGFDDIIVDIEGDEISIPSGTKYTKIFVWNNTTTIIPLAKPAEKNISDMKFGGDSQQIKVAFIGDSITHMANYLKGIEHYYQTRYPNKDIVFVNKGISGNTTASVMERFERDIINDSYTGKIHEATMMIGMNDITRDYYLPGSAATDEQKDRAINKCLENVEKIIGMCEEEGIRLTLITPSAYDESDEFSGASENAKGCNSYGLKKVADGVIALAEKYELPLIDLYTPTTQLIAEQRSSGNTGEIVTGTDRVHPAENGGFYMAYQFIKQQDEDAALVSEVSIDASNGKAEAKNADVTLQSFGADGVTYEYSPKAIPMAYSSAYENAEKVLGCSVTEDINKEIICVAGLNKGKYSVKMGTETLGSYTSEQLAEGINIAVNANNPGQKQAMNAWSTSRQKVVNEGRYRGIALTEQQLIYKNLATSEQIISGNVNVLLPLVQSMIDANPNHSWAKGNYSYYISNSNSEYGSKLYQSQNYERIRAQEKEARNLSVPGKYTITITLEN